MASEYIEDSSGEEREGFRRGGGSRGRGRSGGGRGRGGGRRGGGSRARGRSSKGSRGPGRGSGSSRGKSKASSSKGKSKGRSSARSASVKGARSRTKTKSNAAAASNREAGRLKSQASAGTKSQRKNTSGTRYSGKLAGAMKRANAPKKKDISAADKNKIRNPSKFSPQDVAAALGRKSLAEAAAGKFKSRNAAYKANQTAVDAQKARFKGYSPSKRSDTSAIAGYGGINPKNMGLGVQSAFNTAQNRNETTGMGLLDSARFQVTRPEFKRDVNNLKDLYGKIPTPGNLAMKALGMFGKKPAAPEGTTGSGISGFLSGLKDKFKMGPSMVTPDRRGGQERNRPTFTESNQGGDGPNNQFISDTLFRPTVMPGDPSPTVMPGMENLQQLQQKFGNDGIGNLLARAQQVPTTNYGYGASATAGRENLDRLTASPSYMPLSSFMTAADGGRAGFSEGGSGTEQQQRENFYDFGYDDFLSLEQYMGSAQALRDLERNANGGRIGYQYGGTGAYPSGEVYGGNYAQGGQAQSGSPMVMMTGANSGLGNVLEHYKTIRGKM